MYGKLLFYTNLWNPYQLLITKRGNGDKLSLSWANTVSDILFYFVTASTKHIEEALGSEFHGNRGSSKYGKSKQLQWVSKESQSSADYLAPQVCVVECCQHIWPQNFIASVLQEHLGKGFIAFLSCRWQPRTRETHEQHEQWHSSRSQALGEWRDLGKVLYVFIHMCIQFTAEHLALPRWNSNAFSCSHITKMMDFWGEMRVN